VYLHLKYNRISKSTYHAVDYASYSFISFPTDVWSPEVTLTK
jgi:hypothetical protein